MRRLSIVLLIAASAFVTDLHAQCDPWIVKAYKSIYGKSPNATECNIRNYNNGSWGSYPELVQYIAMYNNNRPGNHLKGDPWIFMAYAELFDRAPRAFELNIKIYNNGSWNSYDELKKYIRDTQEAMQRISAAISEAADALGNTLTVIKRATKTAVSLVNNRGEVKAKGGKAALAAASEALKRLARQKGIQINGNEPGFAPSGKYVTLSGNAEIVPTSGNGAILFE